MKINLDRAWKGLCEGDLEVLAEELGMFDKKEDPYGRKENNRLPETGGRDYDFGGENPGIEKEALGQKNEKGRN